MGIYMRGIGGRGRQRAKVSTNTRMDLYTLGTGWKTGRKVKAGNIGRMALFIWVVSRKDVNMGREYTNGLMVVIIMVSWRRGILKGKECIGGGMEGSMKGNGRLTWRKEKGNRSGRMVEDIKEITYKICDMDRAHTILPKGLSIREASTRIDSMALG